MTKTAQQFKYQPFNINHLISTIMKQISNKAFTKFITLVSNQPITASRLSALIDATPEEGVDVLMFGRLKSVKITNRAELDKFLTEDVIARLWRGSEYRSIESIKITSPMKFAIKVKYIRHSNDAPDKEDIYSLEYSATDDRFDGLLEFEFAD